jgi:putative ABC transport system ATP-binding protein
LRCAQVGGGLLAAILEARNVWRAYEHDGVVVEAVRGIDLTVAAGEFVALMGPSGSGKSTLLQLLGGLDRPTRGTVLVNGVDLTSLSSSQLAEARNRRIGFVFQSFNLLGNLTVAENVAVPAVIARQRPRAFRPRVAELLELVGLGAMGTRLPAQLSGGERQRVAIARALMMGPDILLADEPTGNLDSRSSEEVMTVLAACRERGQTLVLVTHDTRIAGRADRILELRDGSTS